MLASSQDDKLFTKVVYPNCASTEIRTRLRLRSIVRGARNRLDLLSITSYDREAGSSAPIGAQFLHSAQRCPRSCLCWHIAACLSHLCSLPNTHALHGFLTCRVP
jgi:F-box only protein C-terminal region